MKTKLTIVFALLLLHAPVFGHRIDEYLQAIIVSIGATNIHASMRLIPGASVAATVIAVIDSNGDGAFSDHEQHAYAQTVLGDLSLSLDGHPLNPRLEAVSFPSAADMKEGVGEIHIEFAAALPSGAATNRTLIIQNHHETRSSVYLMNCLVPSDPNLQVIAQSRNQNQSYYQVRYGQSNDQPSSFIQSSFGGLPVMFRLGMRHIAEGTDHLLFLLALLLPAPLLAVGSRWAKYGNVRHSLLHILRVVTAFSIGHSITLALGATGLVSLPGRPVEVLIAFSILVCSIHALRPLFPGREPLVAGILGLIHGLAFATTLQNLGVNRWQRFAGILGFNLGIETMQVIVVASILPPLLLLSRTPAYTVARSAGALFAAAASLAWMTERLLAYHTPVDAIVKGIAHRGLWIAAALSVISVIALLRRFKVPAGRVRPRRARGSQPQSVSTNVANQTGNQQQSA